MSRTMMTLLTFGATVFSSGCAVQADLSSANYQQAFRPQLSYSPARNWMNDPNGLVYYEGEYHLFISTIRTAVLGAICPGDTRSVAI
ncbi:hypothetical protein KIV45_12315 [Janthinobacterium lividum]|nr:hypothetical protein KIV45_12315 [Janthinobacterium lividum]